MLEILQDTVHSSYASVVRILFYWCAMQRKAGRDDGLQLQLLLAESRCFMRVQEGIYGKGGKGEKNRDADSWAGSC